MDVDPHFESLQFLDSAGSWSPDGKRLAFAAVRQGRPLLAVLDADNGKVLDEFKFDTLGEIFQPAWSPDGTSIAFAGHAGGVTDLFVFHLDTKTTTRLTQDLFSDMSPVWSPDGKTLAFVTDRFSTNLDTLFFGGFRLATIDAAGGEPHAIETGLHGDQVNPQWTPDGTTVVFISDASGAPNIYRVAAAGGSAEKLTTANTGITGITELSAALSVAAHADRMALTTFREGGYDIHVMPAVAPIPPDEPFAKTVAELPPVGTSRSTVLQLLQNPTLGLPPPAAPDIQSYKPGLHLVSFSQAAGVGVSSAYGAQLIGGASFLFSDVLGDHLLSVTAQSNGTVRDIGAQAFYLNREHRWYWGLEGGTIPLSSALASSGTTIINGQQVFVQQLDIFRQTNTEFGVLTSYPVSRASRIEFSSAVRHIGFTREIETQIYSAITGELLSNERTDLDAPEGINMVDAGAAIVRDTAAFGGTGPVRGQRVRLEVSPAFGDLQLTTVNIDYRQYFMPVTPVTFAVRALHLGRYGSGAEDTRLTPLFIGYPSLVRGYDTGSWRANECTPTADGSCPEFDRLLGSRMFVANFELRAPLVGLFKGRLEYGPVPVEIFGFVDTGLAWTRGTRPTFNGGTQDWATSAGAGARVNVFGYLIAEVDLAKPFNRNRGFMWTFLLRPSW
jgi:hypothetical protein